MRGTRVVVLSLALGACAVGARPVAAGLYNVAEAPLIAPGAEQQYEAFLNRLLSLRPVGIPVAQAQPAAGAGAFVPSSPIARRYEYVAALAARGPSTGLRLEQALSLGDYLTRSKKFTEAAALLNAAVKDGKNGHGKFLLLASLATAQQLDAQAKGERFLFGRATTNFAEALKGWPKDWEKAPKDLRKVLVDLGWDDQGRLLQWFREVEQHHARLAELREREPAPRPGEPRRPLGTEVDALFLTDKGKPVRFTGEGGKYEAGRVADKLPKDAIKVVQQLILWMPEDFRLYWLLAELYNAEGKYLTALSVYGLIRSSLSPKVEGLGGGALREKDYPVAFREREAVLRAAKKKADDDWEKGVNPPPPEDPKKAQPVADGKGADKPAVVEPTPLPFDWRSLGVGVVIGIVVGLLGYMQLREIARRLKGRKPQAA